jgi:hypothetical protein
MDSSPSYLLDVESNQTATAASVTSVPGERNQAVSFMGTINSYFQIGNLISLGTPNAEFSIALYISPNVLSGTVVHISKYQNGMQNYKKKVALKFKIFLLVFLTKVSYISSLSIKDVFMFFPQIEKTSIFLVKKMLKLV